MLVRLIKILPIFIAFGLVGCSILPDVKRFLPDRKVEYKKEKQSEVNLEIPPDLTKSTIDDTRNVSDTSSSGAATYSDYAAEQSKGNAPRSTVSKSEVLPQIEQLKESRSQLINNQNESEIKIAEAFPRAWRLTGMALDRGGFAVEDRDRDQGIYFVRYNDPDQGDVKKGFLSKLAFWDDAGDVDKETQYQVKLIETGKTTRILIQNSKGNPENSDTAKRILGLLHEQLK